MPEQGRDAAVSFGTHIGQQNLAMDDLRALWRRLDAAGLDWISLWDHFYEAPPQDGTTPHFEAVATLAALAAETQHVRVGCLVFCMAYRNPTLLAKAMTTIDHLSHGRLEIGLGAGWHAMEFDAYGYDFPPIGERLDMLEEGVQLLRKLLTQERTTWEGRYFRACDATCLPRPLQTRVPIWIGGRGERRTLRIAARHADSWNAAYVSPSEFARLNGILNEWCEREGRDPTTIRRTVNVSFACVTDPAREPAAEQRIRAEWRERADQILDGSFLGPPDALPERIAAYVEAGAQGINVALRAPWDDDALTAYLEDVVPRMRRALA